MQTDMDVSLELQLIPKGIMTKKQHSLFINSEEKPPGRQKSIWSRGADSGAPEGPGCWAPGLHPPCAIPEVLLCATEDLHH